MKDLVLRLADARALDRRRRRRRCGRDRPVGLRRETAARRDRERCAPPSIRSSGCSSTSRASKARNRRASSAAAKARDQTLVVIIDNTARTLRARSAAHARERAERRRRHLAGASRSTRSDVWLVALHGTYGVDVETASFSSAREPGLVNGQAVAATGFEPMSRWSWWAVGVGAYIAFTLATFPAGTALRWFAPPGVTARRRRRHVMVRAAQRAARSAGSRPRRCAGASGPLSLLLGRISANVEARIPDGFVGGDRHGVAEPRAARGPARRRLRCRRSRACCPCRACAVKPTSRSEALVLENGWPATDRRRAQARGARNGAADSRRQRRPCCRSATTRSPSCRRPTGAACGTVRRQRRAARGRRELSAWMRRATTRSTCSSSRAPVRPRRSSKG